MANFRDQNTADGSATGQIQDYIYADAAEFKAKVDLAAWDLSTACSSCHVGGSGVEHDRNGTRLSQKVLTDAGNGELNAWTSYVEEIYNPLTGMPSHEVRTAPWSYPYDVPTPGGPVTINMPNVKEMDCLYCHLEGYQNLNYSVMTYMGAHNAAPMAGAGLMDMNQASPTYRGYNASMVDVDGSGLVSLNSATLAKIQGNPPEQNCRQCHAPSGLEDIPDMMRDFLSSAPMAYTGSAQSFTGLEMPAFDFNAPFGMSWDFSQGPYYTSPVISIADMMTQPWAYIPRIGYPAAMGITVYNNPDGTKRLPYGPGGAAYTGAPLQMDSVGGGNPAGTGPLYYEAPNDFIDPMMGQDQHALKKGTVPFPRSEWFKRGDLFGGTQDEVHFNMGCAGCHMDTKTTLVDGADATMIDEALVGKTLDGKSQCDPGRGYDSASGIEQGTLNPDGEYVYSRNTVLKCADCHITKTNSDGVPITSNAPNPTSAHAGAGLLVDQVRARKMKTNGSAEEDFVGNHLDAIDCAVCHVYKKQMVVRSLDSTSGNRYPTMLGFDYSKGMLGMFTDPTPSMHNELQEWTPLYTWMKIGDNPKRLFDGTGNPNWRRKIYPVNSIVAAIWNNVGGTVDANGDGVNGRPFGADGNLTNYDPWIQRDLKSGMNFGPSGFAPVPVGFGGPGDGVTSGAFMSAYAMNGSFTGAWNYVGVYGGNVAFTTPEEITAYKNYRTAIAPAINGKSWDETELLYLGGPYMITHNIRRVQDYVLGSSCADCHAPAAGFFSGGFNMTGTAIKATAGQQFMQSPAEIMQVVAKAEDLSTGAELADRNGTGVEVLFEELGCWDAATKTFHALGADMGGGDFCDTGDLSYGTNGYKRVADLERAEVLYPADESVTGADGTVYANRNEWVAYLSRIGLPASATIGTIGGVAANAGAQINVPQSDSVVLVGTGEGDVFTWIIDNDWANAQTGQSVTVDFSTTGVKKVTLMVSDATTGTAAYSYQYVNVVFNPAVPLEVAYDQATDFNAATNTATIGITANFPHTQLYIKWRDGRQTLLDDTSTALVPVQHKFIRNVKKLVKPGARDTWYYAYPIEVIAYNGEGVLAGKETINVTIPFR